MSSFQGLCPLPSTSSPTREDNTSPSNNFNVELTSFLVSLSRTEDMASLEQQLRRLKMAWREVKMTEAPGAGESGKKVNSNVSIWKLFSSL